eukprot:3788499-Alexandrium_andersonii.AAC.1
MRAWTKTSRRVGLGAILDAEGMPAASPTHSARILWEHWAPIFSAKPFESSLASPSGHMSSALGRSAMTLSGSSRTRASRAS